MSFDDTIHEEIALRYLRREPPRGLGKSHLARVLSISNPFITWRDTENFAINGSPKRIFRDMMHDKLILCGRICRSVHVAINIVEIHAESYEGLKSKCQSVIAREPQKPAAPFSARAMLPEQICHLPMSNHQRQLVRSLAVAIHRVCVRAAF